jgi:hypothetical protein
MSLSVSALRRHLAQSAQPNAAQRLLAVLDSQDLRPSSLNPVRSTALDVLRLWETREKTSALSGPVIPGVANLNAHLSQLPPNAPVEQYSFDTKLRAGSIFIDPATGEFLGDTIVERHPKSQEMLDLEAELFQPSRKSA